MNARHPVTMPTRDVVRVLAIIFGSYIAIRLLWVAHPVVFLFFLGILFNEPSTDSVRRKVTRLDSVSVAPETVAATRSVPAGLVVTDSTRAETVATAGAGSVVRKSTTRTEEVAVGGDLRREITRQF